ncbi:MAG: hypothetical protein JOZ43_04265 [Acidobacteriales bacterium]|nr:hypothetical protein [Terriglobales bacterium]
MLPVISRGSFYRAEIIEKAFRKLRAQPSRIFERLLGFSSQIVSIGHRHQSPARV